MKVLFYLNSFPLPSETFIIDQISGLIERGADVTILSLVKGKIDIDNEKVKKYKLIERTVFLANSNNHKLLDRSKEIGFSFFSPKVMERFNFFKYGFVSLNLFLPLAEKKLNNREYDAIVAHFGTAGVAAMKMMEAGVIQGKLFTVFHGADISKKKNLNRYVKEYKELFQFADRLLPISNKWKEELVKLGAEPTKIYVNRMGIDTSKFNISAKVSLDSSTLKIVSVARLVEKKGIDDALKAMSLLKNSGKAKFSYQIVGTGPLQSELLDLVKSLNLQDCVTFYGARQHSFVSDLLKSADIFLLPSKTASDGDMEGIPVSLMESMATGLITLSTYHSGIPELIEHGEDGFLVPEGSPESIAAQIENIISNKSEINTLQERAICKVKEKFNQETLYDDLLNVLRGGS